MPKSLYLLVISALLSSVAARAQTYSATSYGRHDVQIGVGLTVPLGGAVPHANAPRIELSIARDYVDANGGRLNQQRAVRGLQPHALRLGIALNERRTLTINDRPIASPVDQRGLSTVGTVVIGVSVAVIVSAFALSRIIAADSE